MELDDVIRHEWYTAHGLGRTSLRWIHSHADPGDANPTCTAIAQLRAEGRDIGHKSP